MTDQPGMSEEDSRTSRRTLLSGLAGLSALSTVGQAAAATALAASPHPIRKTPLKIDVHHHVLPPAWVEALKGGPDARNIRPWSPEASIAFMDAHAIQLAILSLTSPGVASFEGDVRRTVARKVNDYTAKLVQAFPGRFGNFVTLPLPDVDAALAELEYAYDHLDADGVVLMSNIGDRYLGHESFKPVWDELNRRNAVVFIHPNSLSLAEIKGIPTAMVDFPFATTRTILDVVMKRVFTADSTVRIILSHAGGFLPYVAQRLIYAGGTLPGAPNEAELAAAFGKLFFDTAMSSGASTLAGLKAFADPKRILFGSDFPYAAGLYGRFTDDLDRSPVLSDAEHAAVARVNAVGLFPKRVKA